MRGLEHRPHVERAGLSRMHALCIYVIVLTMGCAPAYDPEDRTSSGLAAQGLPPFGDGGAAFGGVYSYLLATCGTRDCHGRVERPFRVYGASGLASSDREDARRLTYNSLVGIEPERLGEVRRANLPASERPGALLVSAKAFDLQRHKGGKLIVYPSPAAECLLGWLYAPSGAVRTPAYDAACAAAPR
jgi:hypothetical protein